MVDALNFEKKLKTKNKVEELNMNIDEYEKEYPEITSRIEADSAIFKCGMNA